MNNRKYFKLLIISKFVRNSSEYILNSYRKEGMQIGNNTHIFSKIISSEPYLIKIGNDTTISTNVTLLTHDASVGAIYERNTFSDMVGKINIGNHCFIGSQSIILPGVTIADYTLIAAGSVVTKSNHIKGSVLAGNPAKVICSIDEYFEKNKKFFLNLHEKKYKERKKEILNNFSKLVVK